MHSHDHLTVHLNEAAIAVPGEARIIGASGQAFDGVVIEAQVQNRIHHARHGFPGAGADRKQERVGGISETLALLRLHLGHGPGYRSLKTARVGAAVGVESRANLRGQGKARGHGQA